MAIGRQRHEWMMAASIQATQANVMRGKNTAAYRPVDFLPKALRSPVPKMKASEWFKGFKNGG
jgi:hypothetical protein